MDNLSLSVVCWSLGTSIVWALICVASAQPPRRHSRRFQPCCDPSVQFGWTSRSSPQRSSPQAISNYTICPHRPKLRFLRCLLVYILRLFSLAPLAKGKRNENPSIGDLLQSKAKQLQSIEGKKTSRKRRVGNVPTHIPGVGKSLGKTSLRRVRVGMCCQCIDPEQPKKTRLS